MTTVSKIENYHFSSPAAAARLEPAAPDAVFIRIEKVIAKATKSLAIALSGSAAATFTILLVTRNPLAASIFVISTVALSAFGIIKGIEHLRDKMEGKIRKAANYVQATLIDGFAMTLLFLLKPIPFHKLFPGDRSKYKGIPILYIHGYLSNGLTGSYVDHRSQAHGLGPYYHLDLGLPFGKNLEIYTSMVKDKVAQIEKETGMTQIKLVGHSMGGVIATYYTACHAPKDSVTHVVTLGSPLEGTKLANIGIDDCAKSMHSQADFIDNLAAKVNQAVINTRFLHIGSEVDLIIRPPQSSLFLKNKTPHVERILFENIGHSTYLFSDKVVDKVISFLEKKPVEVV